MKMKISRILLASTVAITLLLAACGGSSSSNNNPPPPPQSHNGSVGLTLSDGPSSDWATVGVKVLSIALVPQGGGANVTVYTAPTPAPTINLVELDQLGELIGNATVPSGTYTGAVLTVAANPGDILLTASNDPDSGFAGTPGAAIPPAQIQVQGATGGAGSLTVPVTVKFESPLVVTDNSSNALNLEFDLGHPAFIVDHVPAGGGSTFWGVNFFGPLRHHPIPDITRFLLRHIYGSVNSVSDDNTTLNIARAFPAHPITSPETAVVTSNNLPILADSVNGTLFYDVDAKTRVTIKDFSTVTSALAAGKFVRVAARYQPNGSLVAVRIWVSSTFNSVWISPEGHVLHVNTNTNVITVENEDGHAVKLTVDANTEFFYRTPQNALADSQPISTGTAMVQNKDIVRGFKVHASVVDPLASPLVAQTIDIEIAKYDGVISAANTASFVDTRHFPTGTDTYSVTVPYIDDSTANGKDANGSPISGFKWWNVTFPTLVNSGGEAAKTSFVGATGGAVNFGGTVGALNAWGTSYVTWNDPAGPNDWSAMFTILEPTPIPMGTVGSPFVIGTNAGSFGMNAFGGANTVTVNLSAVSGSATLVYQVDRSNGIVTISPQDITTTSGMNNVAAKLVNGTLVKVFGVPQSDGTIKAYTVFFYTGVMPMHP